MQLKLMPTTRYHYSKKTLDVAAECLPIFTIQKCHVWNA